MFSQVLLTFLVSFYYRTLECEYLFNIVKIPPIIDMLLNMSTITHLYILQQNISLKFGIYYI